MENKYFKVNHQGPGWDHFKARYVYKKNYKFRPENEKGTLKKKIKNNIFMDNGYY